AQDEPCRKPRDGQRDILAAVENHDSVRRDRATQLAQRPPAAVVEDCVVSLLAQIVLARVVEDTVGPEPPGSLDFFCTTDSGYVRAVLLRDLHAEAPHATGRPGDRDPLTCPELRVITQRFECHISCDRDPCRLLETQTVGLWDD